MLRLQQPAIGNELQVVALRNGALHNRRHEHSLVRFACAPNGFCVDCLQKCLEEDVQTESHGFHSLSVDSICIIATQVDPEANQVLDGQLHIVSQRFLSIFKDVGNELRLHQASKVPKQGIPLVHVSIFVIPRCPGCSIQECVHLLGITRRVVLVLPIQAVILMRNLGVNQAQNCDRGLRDPAAVFTPIALQEFSLFLVVVHDTDVWVLFQIDDQMVCLQWMEEGRHTVGADRPPLESIDSLLITEMRVSLQIASRLYP